MTPPEFHVLERWLEWLDSHDGRLSRRARGDNETDSDLIATIPNPPGKAIFTIGDLRAIVEAGRTLHDPPIGEAMTWLCRQLGLDPHIFATDMHGAGGVFGRLLGLLEGSMSLEVTLFIGEEGELEFIHNDDAAEALQGAGPRQIRRASHVEPDGDDWTVDVAPILNSPTPIIIGRYATRAAALEAEMEWVLNHLASTTTPPDPPPCHWCKQPGCCLWCPGAY